MNDPHPPPSQGATARELASARTELAAALERLHIAVDELEQAGRPGWANCIDRAVGQCDVVIAGIDREGNRG